MAPIIRGVTNWPCGAVPSPAHTTCHPRGLEPSHISYDSGSPFWNFQPAGLPICGYVFFVFRLRLPNNLSLVYVDDTKSIQFTLFICFYDFKGFFCKHHNGYCFLLLRHIFLKYEKIVVNLSTFFLSTFVRRRVSFTGDSVASFLTPCRATRRR